jgi:hypothetical protein
MGLQKYGQDSLRVGFAAAVGRLTIGPQVANLPHRA